MKVLYKPFAIIASILGKRAGKQAFAGVWARLGYGEKPPASNVGPRGLPSVFFTAALQAAILAGTGAMMDQLFARAFHHLFGAWPGKLEQPDETADAVGPPAT
jgi:hypothetical protein